MASPRAKFLCGVAPFRRRESKGGSRLIDGLRARFRPEGRHASLYATIFIKRPPLERGQPGNASATIRTDSSVALSGNGLRVQTGDYTDQSSHCQVAATTVRRHISTNFRAVNLRVGSLAHGRRKGRLLLMKSPSRLLLVRLPTSSLTPRRPFRRRRPPRPRLSSAPA
jgi:hypothetical protein